MCMHIYCILAYTSSNREGNENKVADCLKCIEMCFFRLITRKKKCYAMQFWQGYLNQIFVVVCLEYSTK